MGVVGIGEDPQKGGPNWIGQHRDVWDKGGRRGIVVVKIGSNLYGGGGGGGDGGGNTVISDCPNSRAGAEGDKSEWRCSGRENRSG